MPSGISKTKRIKVYIKTGGRCAYCGSWIAPCNFHVEHSVPKISGGSNRLQNLLPSCAPCNHSKGYKTLEEFRVWTRVKHIAGLPFTLKQIEFLEETGCLDLIAGPAGIRRPFYFEEIGLEVES